MPTPRKRAPAPLPSPAEPQYHGAAFDPWNSVSTGHQRAETREPQGWHESRNLKLHGQFRGGHAGGERLADTAGEGAEDFDEKHRVFIPKEVRARAANSVADMLRKPGTMTVGLPLSSTGTLRSCSPEKEAALSHHHDDSGRSKVEAGEVKVEEEQQCRGIFDGLVIYVNGSTHPLISDHKLKRLLAEHGAHTSIHLGRRQVTHVILGKPSGPSGGAGGGLAGGKLEKEIRRVGGNGIKYVSVEWVLESVKAGKRLPEARFANLKIAARGQQSVLHAFSKAATASSSSSKTT
ncbi:hypothetical protein B0H63DRAFT_313490 [Podospora didyma]|uniref:BRCT domain-containing protein n=1 Tax=Podospora didyma TaxID=330526 RepID=A0AAE0K6C8_9PEZI|nr:hypothetical protein B0H63DRAFT_313490 [Podospora didyma]